MLPKPMQKGPLQCSSMHKLTRQTTARQQHTAQPPRQATTHWQASWGQSQSELLSRHLPPWHHRQRASQDSLQLCTGPSQRYFLTLSCLRITRSELHVHRYISNSRLPVAVCAAKAALAAAASAGATAHRPSTFRQSAPRQRRGRSHGTARARGFVGRGCLRACAD